MNQAMFQVVVSVEVKGFSSMFRMKPVWCVVGCYDWDGSDDTLEKILQRLPFFSVNTNVNWHWEIILKADSSLFMAAISVIDMVKNAERGQ